MFGLSSLGLLHTLISLVALAAGALALLRTGRIDAGGRAGRVFLWATVLTCLSGFFIFRHGGFGPPHALGVLTLAVLALAVWAQRRAQAGGGVSYVGTLGFTFAFFLHFIPGVTETFTRLPSGAPLFSGPEDPALKPVIGLLFLVFVAGAAWQAWRLRAAVAAGRRAWPA